MKQRHFTLVLFLFLLMQNCFAQYIYKPKSGDKFTYRISKNNKVSEAVFIYDIHENSTVFYWKKGIENPEWGTLKRNEKNFNCLSSNIDDTAYNRNCNLIFLNKESFKLLKSKKKINFTVDNKNIVFSFSKSEEFKMPVSGAEFKFKLITVTSADKRYSLSFIDNVEFPMIISLIADAAWQLQSVVPLPMYPITFDITGKTITDKSVVFFKNYTKGTCTNLKAEYTENYKTLIFDEYFCPITGIRFTLKNDTIVSVVLVGKDEKSNDFRWNKYKGYFWGVYGLGTSRETIEKQLGKADSEENGKFFYRNRGFYLIYNSKNELESVEYE